jgi:hypothetical protein
MKHDDFNGDYRDLEAVNHAESVFGIRFMSGHDWSSTNSYSVSIQVNPVDFEVSEVGVLTCSPFGNGDGNGSLLLNKSYVKTGDEVVMSYDVPVGIDRLYVACFNDKGECRIKGFNVGDKEVSFSKGITRGVISDDEMELIASLPSEPVLGDVVISYARQRGYAGFENDTLYNIVDGLSQMMLFSDYDEEYKQDLRDVIFTYLPNKKSNLTKISQHRYYNANCYPITTGDEPIIIDLIYKNDGGWKEIEKCALYYYYFKEDDIVGLSEEESVQFIKDLPKFRMIDYGDCVFGRGVSPGMQDDVLRRGLAYVAIYWGDNPSTGCVGSYQFPQGYKIGFMVRNEGKDVHKGELYCDGRLNNEVNKWGHLASSKLGDNDARMAWLTCNGKNYLCCESGTDSDFNDIVMEVEGGIEPIGDLPEIEYNRYTYCFEDTRLGDYDMNDVVIKARRLSETKVEYRIVACGAMDNVYVMNINGKRIKDDVEVHSMFGAGNEFINTVSGSDEYEAIVDTVDVVKSFSFLDENTMPYIYDDTRNHTVRISKVGEDPHGIMIPFNFRYPLERVCIKDAYLKFNNWGQNKVLDTDWYQFYEENKVW